MGNGDVKSLEDYRKKSGAKAHAFGRLFETMFEQMCKKVGVACTRFPDGCRSAGGASVTRVKTPWDWIVTHKGITGLIDTKTSDQLTFPHSKITNHQIAEMVHHEMQGAKAGYVIWLRKPNCVVFVPSLELARLARYPGSIQEQQESVTLLGSSSFFDVRLLFQKNDQGPIDAG